jgi:hypothetical protein
MPGMFPTEMRNMESLYGPFCKSAIIINDVGSIIFTKDSQVLSQQFKGGSEDTYSRFASSLALQGALRRGDGYARTIILQNSIISQLKTNTACQYQDIVQYNFAWEAILWALRALQVEVSMILVQNNVWWTENITSILKELCFSVAYPSSSLEIATSIAELVVIVSCIHYFR